VYAIIEESGKQFRVSKGDLLRVDLIKSCEKDSTVEFDRVLLLADGQNITVGTPIIAGAKVIGKIEAPEVRGEKIKVIKFRRRKGYRVIKGHRQRYTEVRITEIVPPGGSKD